MRYQDELSQYSLSDLKGQMPLLQQRVYDALLALTPNRLQFELSQIPLAKETFNREYCDDMTLDTIKFVMAALLDDAGFVLTRHSRMYREWKEGKRPALTPVDRPWSFADNDLSFEGVSFFDRFDAPLAASLDAWMEGNGLDTSVSRWFGKKAPHTSLVPDMVESLIAKAEQELDRMVPQPASEAHWIAGTPMLKSLAGGRAALVWAYRGEVQSLELSQQKAQSVGEILSSAALDADGVPYASLEADLALPPDAMSTLCATGLVVV